MNLRQLIVSRIQSSKKAVLAVAVAEDAEVLSAVTQAMKLNLVDAILVGHEEEIRKVAGIHGLDLHGSTLIHEPDPVLACETAVKLVSSGKADLLMKGLVDTSVLLKAVLNKDWGLRTDHLLSHVTVFTVPDHERLFFMSDGAMNIAPELMAKKQIIENVLPVTRALGLSHPKVAVVCAVEKVNPKMQATLDAQALSDMAKAGEIVGCDVDGPFAMDNAISIEAAHHKGITNVNAGRADVLLMPNIEAGNILYKAMTFLAKGTVACVISGAQAPIVLTSRADDDEAKLNSIALAVLMTQEKTHG